MGPIAGCVDPKVAEKRAKAFAAGTVTGAVNGGRQDSAARFYAAETAKVLQGFLHAAASNQPAEAPALLGAPLLARQGPQTNLYWAADQRSPRNIPPSRDKASSSRL